MVFCFLSILIHHLVFSDTDDWTEAGRVVSYDINACTNTTMLCPAIGRKTYCPCVSIQDTTQCMPAVCHFNPNGEYIVF
jgi:hypothetical protein